MSVLCASGGIIFLLPFLLEIYAIPLSDALHLNNTEVGTLMSAFGVTAMFSYLPGGWLADRASPRKLISLALISTGAAGLYFATFPSYVISLAIHGLWGVTITLLFWGSMIRVTRNWAPAEEQGRAFGILESGRGIAEALTASSLAAAFALMGSDQFALSTVIAILSSITAGLGVVAWFVLGDESGSHSRDDSESAPTLIDVVKVIKLPVVWLIGIVVLTAYCAYWATFQYATYAKELLGYSVGIAATIGATKNYFKPAAAFVAGFVSDKMGIARSVAFLFVVLIAAFVAFALLPAEASLIPVIVVVGVIILLCAFALRGIYFALLDEGGIPLAVTGTAAGVVSTIGYTPDIFMPVLGGFMRDNFPGADGYRYYFLTTAGICTFGLLASLVIYFKYARQRQPQASSTNV